MVQTMLAATVTTAGRGDETADVTGGYEDDT
jgi:hypothetical protein